MVEMKQQTDPWPLVAERLWLVCPRATDWNCCEQGCAMCNATEKVFPLRKPCSNLTHGASHGTPAMYCSRYNCRGWEPITDLDLVLAAVRAKGWYLVLSTETDEDKFGDEVQVYDMGGALLGRVRFDEPNGRLRGTAAIGEALLRALEKEAGS